MATVLICGNVFDGVADTLRDRTEILIQDSWIVAMAESVIRPSLVEVIDLTRLTIMPRPIMRGLLPGREESRELYLLVQSGIAAVRVLQAATSSAAVLMGRPDLGVLAPGKRANMIGVFGDPFEDISVVGKPGFVMVDGRIERRPSRRSVPGVNGQPERRSLDRLVLKMQDLG
ncbi:MAG TPA: amidohydrolase family protein [Thermomicrobiales bacterium]|nr:amidohydrolase family protein [Thermomicrobiales bacterium]